jgi:hypothetical protein
MKKMIAALLIGIIGLSAHAGSVTEGAGATGTATTTAAVVLVPGTNYCYGVSIDNEGAVPIRFIKKLTEGATTNGFVAADSLIVPAGKSYTTAGGTMMNENKRRQIFAIVIATESSTADYSINFE